MRNKLIITGGKLASNSVKKLQLGHGSTWPGHIALKINPHFIRDVLRNSNVKVIVIAGTNGKTTSSRMLRTILEADGKRVLHNESGANLLNGIASSLLLQSSSSVKLNSEYVIFEVDEKALPTLLQEITPDYLLLLNLFRDQLDRYGEISTISDLWKQAINKLPDKTTIIANADDPRTAFLGMQKPTSLYFGLDPKIDGSTKANQAVDSVYCPHCHAKLHYTKTFYSHLGIWECKACGLKRPHLKLSEDIKTSLSGTYNKSNAHGINVLSHEIGTQGSVIAKALTQFVPAFGRQEKIVFQNKTVQLFLSKNPTGLNESLSTVEALGGKHVLFVLNDRYADGTDVSWIWDVDIESYLPSLSHVTIAGDRCYDMGLRLKYASNKEHSLEIRDDLEKALQHALTNLPENETLYVFPTYTAMLEVRKILTGRKIL